VAEFIGCFKNVFSCCPGKFFYIYSKELSLFQAVKTDVSAGLTLIYITLTNMSNSEIIIFSLVIILVGIRLYIKYFNKNRAIHGSTGSKGSFPWGKREDDDYEPYSKK
jgi:hypothetical protein